MENKKSKFDEFMAAAGLEAGDTVFVEGKGRMYSAVIVHNDNPKTVLLIDNCGMCHKFDANTMTSKTGDMIGGVPSVPLRLSDLEFEFASGIELGDTVMLSTSVGPTRAVFCYQSLDTLTGVFLGEDSRTYHIKKDTFKGSPNNAKIVAMSEIPCRIKDIEQFTTTRLS